MKSIERDLASVLIAEVILCEASYRFDCLIPADIQLVVPAFERISKRFGGDSLLPPVSGSKMFFDMLLLRIKTD